MKVLYFDCFSGISGDMTLGALLDLGVDQEAFKSELDKLNLAAYDLVIQRKVKNSITVTDVDVVLHEEYGHYQKRVRIHEQHAHDAHGHSHSHEDHKHHHGIPARNLKSIEELIDTSELKQAVKDFSKKVFREIAAAEARVHNKSMDEIHFHEVGAIDSIVDIVGISICLDLLGIQKVFSSPLHEGKGFIECQHGLLPVPVPAVMEMLKGSQIPIVTEEINTELVTPTGIGIVKCLASRFGDMPAMVVDKAGYGAGKREIGRFNALRVVMGELFEGGEEEGDQIILLETNIDDMSPEIMGHVMERLLKNGAHDVFYTPVYMKKNRPGVLLTVLCSKETEPRLVDILLKETTTIGMRRSKAERYCMDREIKKVETPYGTVGVKLASRGEIHKFAPEYEDCREIAETTGKPLKDIYQMVIEKARGLN